jgi:integrase
MAKKKTWPGRVYIGIDPETGKQQFEWLGRFDTKRERDAVVAEAKRLRGTVGKMPTCDAQADRYLADYKRRNKRSSWQTQTQRLKRFKRDWAGQPLDIPRTEMKDWFNGEGKWKSKGSVPIGDRQAIVSMFNHAIDDDDVPLPKSPARGFSELYDGRAEDPPPTEDEFQRLLDACEVLGNYALMMRAIILFATYELMRPSELFALEPSDVDFVAMRVVKDKRFYRGEIDAPKTGPKTIALVPPARDAIAGLPLDGPFLFTSKEGGRLTRSSLDGCWKLVCARAGLDFDFYHATKHYGVWFYWTQMGMSDRAIAAQAGWKVKTVQKMLGVYGHGDVGALAEVDAAWAAAAEAERVTAEAERVTAEAAVTQRPVLRAV